MPKDYVKYVNKRKRQLVERGWRRRLWAVGVLLSLLGGAGYGFYAYQTHSSDIAQQSLSSWMVHVKSLLGKSPHKRAVSEPSIRSNQKDVDKQDPDIQFSFYTKLPDMQVSVQQKETFTAVIKNEDVKSSPLKRASAMASVKKSADLPIVDHSSPVDEKYLLQIAAFRNPVAAGEMRISLLLAGFEVEVVAAMKDNQQIYQLQQGPISTMAQVRSMQQALKKKGIESVIVKKKA